MNWAIGLSFPDVSLYKKLCNELDISIEELINGEKDDSDEAKDRAIISTVKFKNKIKRKFFWLFVISIIIIVSLIICGVFLYKSEEEKLADYYERNFQKTVVARDVDAMLKYRNEGKYPDYYGGVYISDDSYYLIIQVVEEKIPKNGTLEYLYYNELITLNDCIKIEYVKNSYNDLEDVYNKLNEYFSSHDTLNDMSGYGIDIMKNRVMVSFVDANEDVIKNFKKLVLDSDLIEFESAKYTTSFDGSCTNYPSDIGDELLNKSFDEILISVRMESLGYIPVQLQFYDDGTYELFTAYQACKPGVACNDVLVYTKSIKGKYNYDLRKVIEASTNRDDFSYVNGNLPKYEISLGSRLAEEYDSLEFVVEKNKSNKYLDVLLDIINVDLSNCAKPEYE